MNIDNWLIPNLCLVTVHGSQAYGTNTSKSDVDVKGIVIPPPDIRHHLFEKFEQAINNPGIEDKFSYLKNPNNPKFESTIYSLDKFFILAAAVNPNCIEIIGTDESDIQFINPIGKLIRENLDLFISSRCKFTYSGYSFSQFYKIERHRKWLLKGELQKPVRKDYSLPEEQLKSYREIDRLIKRDIENWNLSTYNLDDLSRNKLKDTIFEAVYRLSTNKIDWSNWPEKFEAAALTKFFEDFNISKEINQLILQETKYKNDLREYNNWLHWKENRNLERKKTEIDFGWDVKHGNHLVRLMRTGCELLEGKGLIVKRPDAKELLAIRNGEWTYEQLKAEFDILNEKLEFLYKNTKLPRSVNYERINELYHQICKDFDKSN